MINFFEFFEGTQLLIVIIAYVGVILISLGLHELAHAYVAYKNGDSTPKANGRITLNPLAHFDMFGFLLILFLGFGWAKPVEINPIKFRNFKKGYFWTSVAGVIVNYSLAFIAFPLLVLLGLSVNFVNENVFLFLYYFLHFMFSINLVLFAFNLLPIYPLDGFRVVEVFTKNKNKYVNFMYQYGSFVLLGVVIVFSRFYIFDTLTRLIGYPITLFWNLVLGGVL